MVKLTRLGMWSFFAIGLGIAVTGLILAYRTVQFKKSAVVTRGTVVGLVEQVSQSEEGTSVVYAPQVSFRTADGQETGFLSSTGSNPPGFRTGETVEVMYAPGHPEQARINTFWQLYLAPVICVGVGGVFLLASIFVFAVVSFLVRQEARQSAPAVGLALRRRSPGGGRQEGALRICK